MMAISIDLAALHAHYAQGGDPRAVLADCLDWLARLDDPDDD